MDEEGKDRWMKGGEKDEDERDKWMKRGVIEG